jgi:hypothetical protein
MPELEHQNPKQKKSLQILMVVLKVWADCAWNPTSNRLGYEYSYMHRYIALCQSRQED